jgi:hypothetical protein
MELEDAPEPLPDEGIDGQLELLVAPPVILIVLAVSMKQRLPEAVLLPPLIVTSELGT